jgi:hypothetical protein
MLLLRTAEQCLRVQLSTCVEHALLLVAAQSCIIKLVCSAVAANAVPASTATAALNGTATAAAWLLALQRCADAATRQLLQLQ